MKRITYVTMRPNHKYVLIISLADPVYTPMSNKNRRLVSYARVRPASHSNLFFSLAWQKISLAFSLAIGLTSVPLEIGKSSVETYV